MRLLTLARDLARRKARERDGLCVVEGVRAVESLLVGRAEVLGVLVGSQLKDTARGAALSSSVIAAGWQVTEVSDREFASAATTDSPQGVLAIARVPVRSLEVLSGRARLRFVVLDGLQDPGNVGTIVRTAFALGADATLALPGTVDVWNAKVVRSAVGALFSHHVQAVSHDELLSFARTEGCALWAADMGGAPLGTEPAPAKLGLVVGNEGAGVSPALRTAVSHVVSLPMVATAESLNVAVATGIILHALRV